jgi:hypothetical protein
MKSLKITIEVTCMVPNATELTTDTFGEIYIKNVKESLFSCPEIHGIHFLSSDENEVLSEEDEGRLEDFIYNRQPKYTTMITLGDEKKTHTKNAFPVSWP